MRHAMLLVGAAVLEIGGDALVRWGIRGERIAGYLLGAGTLFLYGLTVNSPGLDFGRLMGAYICVFFVVSQLIALIAFHEPVRIPVLAGGALIVAGGLVLTFWKPA